MPVVAAAQETAVSHHLSFPELRRQWVNVRSRFPAPAQPGPIELRLPTWTPGSYLQQPFDANLEILSVRAGSAPVAWRKVETDTWRVAFADGPVEVTYRVRADRRGVSTSWASEDWVALLGTSIFLYTDATRDAPQALSVEPPAGLQQVAVPLDADGTASGRWMAADYDELVDAPVVLARSAPATFEVDGHGYRFWNLGDNSLWDVEAVVGDLEGIVRATHALFEGDVPLERDYWFINVLDGGSGGLEHDHSTVMQASRWQMRDRRDYLQWLSLAAHEYLHAWNVRRMRPEALARYDYRRAQYTDSLWVAEGLVSYYDDLLLSRAGVATPAEYLERLARNLHALELTPGRQRLSLAQASRDAWTRHYQPGVNSLNQNVSYYIKGAVVGFVLDARLREATRDRASLDDVLRLMWDRWGETPYPEEAIYAAVTEVGGAGVADWLRPMVEGFAELDVDAALDRYGLVLERHPVRSAAEASGAPVPAGLGINWETTGTALVAAAVIDGGAAAAAGMLPGDELIAVAGERMTRVDFETKLRRLAPGTDVELLVSRQGRIQSLRAVLGVARPAYYEVRAGEGFSDRDRRRLEDWLGQSL